MDEIAAQAGVARSTVYVYFSNRDDLLRACVQSMYDRMQDTVALVVTDGAPPMERLRLLILGLLERIDESPAFFRLAMATQATAGAAGSRRRRGRPDDDRARHDPRARGARRWRAWRPGTSGPTLDPERAVVLVGQQIYGALSVRAGEPDPIPAAQAADEICDFVRRGLGN